MSLGAPALKPGPKPPAPPTLQGEWAVESFITDGRPAECVGMTFEFATDGRMTFRTGGKVDEELRYSAPPGKAAELDWVENGGRHRLPGIYKFDGDALVICIRVNPDGPRPTAFTSPARSDCALITLKRVKKD
jgi:uncharacterized protein (TIGR03067 family)